MSTSQRRIVHFSIVHPVADVRIFRKECGSLRDAGYDVTLYGRGQGGLIDGVRVVSVREYRSRFRRITVGPAQLFRDLIRERADLYHFHDPELLPVGLVLRALGKRVIYDAHEWVPGDVASKPYLHPLLARTLGWMVARLESIAARTLSQVVTATPFIAAQLPAGRVTVIQNYPDLDELSQDFIAPVDQRDPNTIVYVGGFSTERCGEEILEAMKLVSVIAPDVRLIVAGGIEDGLDPMSAENIDHLGFLDRSEVRDVLARGVVGIVFLRDLPKFRDALPTKFFEYLAAGLAVLVSSSNALIADITKQLDCGRVVDESDPAAIADAIAGLLRQPDELVAMGVRGRAAVHERYQWRPEGDRLVELYDRLICAH